MQVGYREVPLERLQGEYICEVHHGEAFRCVCSWTPVVLFLYLFFIASVRLSVCLCVVSVRVVVRVSVSMLLCLWVGEGVWVCVPRGIIFMPRVAATHGRKMILPERNLHQVFFDPTARNKFATRPGDTQFLCQATYCFTGNLLHVMDFPMNVTTKTRDKFVSLRS